MADDFDVAELLAEFMPRVIRATKRGRAWKAQSGRARIAMAEAEQVGLVSWADDRYFIATDAGLAWTPPGELLRGDHG